MADDSAAVPGDITRWLKNWSGGDSGAFSALAPLVYDQLRQIARQRLSGERGDHTLQPTALVNEAFLVLVRERGIDWQNRAHFFALASRLMRRILIDHARARSADKRDGGRILVSLEAVDALGAAAVAPRDVDLMALDQALDRLSALDQGQAALVEMRFFGGLSIDETAEVLGISAPTVKRRLRSARAFLHQQLSGA